jgi:EAL domain-containing protein (putative c-di-GMP-specific phosphodiesterase class I)/PleD family two-component response regulator
MLPVLPIAQKLSTKVLVVESQEFNSDALISILNSLGIIEIFNVSDYQNFKSCYRSFLPDLLVLDLDVSCGSAELIIEWLRSDSQGRLVPILVSTSLQNEGINRALAKGANDYIQSPFVASQVSVRISNLMQLSNYDVHSNGQLFDQRLQMGIKALQSETLRRNQAEQALDFQANHEYHSGLPNRIFLQKVLAQCLKNELSTPLKTKTLAVFHLHHFNEINNTLGHSHADEILVEMALRFSLLCQKYPEVMSLQYGLYDQSGPVALLDRTHFSLVINNIQPYCLGKIIEQILIDSSQPFQYQGMQIETPIAVGFAQALVGDDVASWMRRAHVALKFAEQEKQPWAGYSEKADRYSKKKLTLIADLRNAIACDQGLFLHYQPQFNCQNGLITGVEVLLRWNHPVYGPLPADEIVALAEQTGLIQSLTHWVISHAFSQHQKVLAAGFELTLSINLSTLNLWQDNLLEEIAQLLNVYEIPAKQLILEVTETVLLKKPKRSLEFLNCLTAMGIRIALDDFGTGFSSLAYLKKMPVSELKIDRSFIQELCDSHEDQVIVAAIIAMCQGLGIEVVAEGIEDMETQLKLEALGCDRLQGYFLAKPLLGADLLLRLANYRH